MKRIYFTTFFILTALTNLLSQTATLKIAKPTQNLPKQKNERKTNYHGIISVDYIYQGTNNFAYTLGGKIYNNKTFTYLGIYGGAVLFYNKKTAYLTPNINLEAFYRLKPTSKKLFGPFCKIGFSSYKILGLKDNIISSDLGFRFKYIAIFGGYNFNLDKRDLTKITNYRIGVSLKMP